jgi:hypothetical protein
MLRERGQPGLAEPLVERPQPLVRVEGEDDLLAGRPDRAGGGYWVGEMRSERVRHGCHQTALARLDRCRVELQNGHMARRRVGREGSQQRRLPTPGSPYMKLTEGPSGSSNRSNGPSRRRRGRITLVCA